MRVLAYWAARLGIFLENEQERAFERAPAGGFAPVPLDRARREENRDGAALLQVAESLLLESRYRAR